MFCSNCGERLDDNARFCPTCGTKVEAMQSPIVPPVVNEQPQEVYANPAVNEQPQDIYINSTENEQPQNVYTNPAVNEQPQDIYINSTKNEQPQSVYANPVVNEQPQEVYANPTINEQPQDPYATSGMQPQDPYATSGVQPQDSYATSGMQPQDPYATSGIQPQAPYATSGIQPQDPYATSGIQPQAPYVSPSIQTQDNQWNPLTPPDKKSKKPLIIGLICAALVIVVIVVIVVLFACNGNNDDKKETTKTGNKEAETTETIEPATDKKTDSADEAAQNLLNKCMEAIKSKDLDSYKEVFIEEVYNQLLEYKIYEDINTLTDEEILLKILNFDLEEFGDVVEYTVNDIEQLYSLDGKSKNDGYELTGNDEIITIYSYNGTVTVKSDTRTATFELDFDLYEQKNGWSLDNIYFWNYSFVDYDYSYNGDGRDEFRYLYDSDYEYEPYTTDSKEDPTKDTKEDPTEVSSDKLENDEIWEYIKDYIVIEGTGVSSEDKLVEEYCKAFLSMNYADVKKNTYPILMAMYDMLVDSELMTEKEFFGEFGVKAVTEVESVKVDKTEDAAKDIIDGINSSIEEEIGSKELSSVMTISDGKNIDGTISYKKSNGDKGIVGFSMVILKVDTLWYVLSIDLDDYIE